MCFKKGPGNTYGPVFIYNNVFENDNTFGDYQPGFLGFSNMVRGSEVANNIFENVSSNAEDSPPNANHNAYTLSGASDGGPGSFYYSPGRLGASTLFVDESPGKPTAADFHLSTEGAATLATGKTLRTPYNMDPDGNIRGANGSWTIGAFEPSSPRHPATSP